MSDLDTMSLFVKGHSNFKTICNSLNDNGVQFKHPARICDKPFVFNQVPKNVFQFTVVSRRNWQITNKPSPQKLSLDPRSPHLSCPLSCPQGFWTCLLECRRSICPYVKSSIFNRNPHCLVRLFLLPTPEQSLLVISAFEISFLQVAKTESAFSADWWLLCDKPHLESQPALPGDLVLGLCKVKDRPLQPGIYAFKMLISPYETIKYFLQATAGERRKRLKYLTWSAKDA